MTADIREGEPVHSARRVMGGDPPGAAGGCPADQRRVRPAERAIAAGIARFTAVTAADNIAAKTLIVHAGGMRVGGRGPHWEYLIPSRSPRAAA